MRALTAAWTAACLLMLQGCALSFQYLAGWSEEVTGSATRKHAVEISTEPPDREVTRRDPEGRNVKIGRAPLTDTVDYTVIETRERASALWPFYLGLAFDVIAYTPGLLAGTLGDEPKAGIIVPLAILLGLTLAADWFAYRRWHPDEERVLKEEPVGGGAVFVYSMLQDGIPQAEARLRAPWDRSLQLAGSAPVTLRENRGVVAVMNVRDAQRTDPKRAAEPTLLRSLTDQLRVHLTQAGFQTIDRSQQDTALADLVRGMKRESYAACYDESCQLELGKALAARFLVRSELTRFGSRCVLIGELIDLKTEVTVSAGTADGGCEPEALLGAAREIVGQLANPSAQR